MGWLFLILLAVVSAFSFYLGLRYVGSMKSKWWLVPAFGTLSIIGLFAIFSHFPEIEYKVVPSFLGVYIESLNYTPFATFFFGIAVGRIRRRLLRIELVLLAVLIICVGFIRMEWAYLDQDVYRSEQTVNKYGICFQSTGYSCGAASAVIMLRYYGVVTTEGDMAQLSHSGPRTGVEMVNLAWAIAKRLEPKGLTVDLIRGDWEILKAIKLPCIIVIKYSALVDHVVVLIELKDDKALIGDPLGDQHWLTKDKFLSNWRRNAIIVR